MMLPIRDYREMHEVPNAHEFKLKHERFIKKKQMKGSRVTMHVDETPIPAEVNQGNWVIRCQCNAGNAVDLQNGEARCFGCGAHHVNVIVPLQRDEGEALLLKRPDVETRNWLASESVADLVIENAHHGVGV